jgi:SAM-dependent methyltransferase
MTNSDQTKSAQALVQRAAGLYTHINDLRDDQGQKLEGQVNYHLGVFYATEQLGNKLEGLGVDSSWRILDLCSGWGGPSCYIAGRFGCTVIGVDITARSVELARALAKGTDVESRVSFREGSALDVPVPDGSTDLVWSQDALCHVPERHRAIEQCFRVLRPGGYMVFTDWLRTPYITPQEFETFSTAWSFPGLETMESYGRTLTGAGFEMISAEGVGREYAHAAESLAVGGGNPTFIQRTALRDDENVRKVVERFGLQAHLDRLEREKMDIHFAQGKLELGRFVCKRPEN